MVKILSYLGVRLLYFKRYKQLSLFIILMHLGLCINSPSAWALRCEKLFGTNQLKQDVLDKKIDQLVLLEAKIKDHSLSAVIRSVLVRDLKYIRAKLLDENIDLDLELSKRRNSHKLDHEISEQREVNRTVSNKGKINLNDFTVERSIELPVVEGISEVDNRYYSYHDFKKNGWVMVHNQGYAAIHNKADLKLILEINLIKEHQHTFGELKVTDDESRLVFSSTREGSSVEGKKSEIYSLWVYNVKDKRLIKIMEESGELILVDMVAGSNIAIIKTESRLVYYDLENGVERKNLAIQLGDSQVVSSGFLFEFIESKNQVRLWDLTQTDLNASKPVTFNKAPILLDVEFGKKDDIYGFKFSKNRRYFAFNNGLFSSLRVYDLEKQKLMSFPVKSSESRWDYTANSKFIYVESYTQKAGQRKKLIPTKIINLESEQLTSFESLLQNPSEYNLRLSKGELHIIKPIDDMTYEIYNDQGHYQGVFTQHDWRNNYYVIFFGSKEAGGDPIYIGVDGNKLVKIARTKMSGDNNE